MKYYSYLEDDNTIGGGTAYLEVAEDGYPVRNIAVNGEQYLASNIWSSKGHFYLLDAQIDPDELPDEAFDEYMFTEITEAEFEAVWQKFLAKHQPEWLKNKDAYPVGTTVSGWTEVIYPQGVMVVLDDRSTVGVADYAACKASTPHGWVVKYRISAVVSGYDETNHWLILDQPTLSIEKLQNYASPQNQR